MNRQVPTSEASPGEWRAAENVLVAEAHAIGSIAVIRSLGRAGYRVHGCSSDSRALGLASKYASVAVVSPDYTDPVYAEWLREYVDRNRVSAIVPSEGLLLAIRPRFTEFATVLPFAQDEKLVYMGLSKHGFFNALTAPDAPADVQRHLPRLMLFDDSSALPPPEALAGLGWPVYVKSDACRPGESGVVYRASTAEVARERLGVIKRSLGKAVVQGHVQGVGVGAFFLLWKGKVMAEFMHRRLHEVPHTGGASSLRESWCHSGILEDALAKLSYLGWQGVAMLEYRWNPETDEFCLIEMNGRFWGSLHLALYAGVDFPALLLDSFYGHAPEPVTSYQRGVRSRLTFPREVQYVWSRLKDGDLPLLSRAWSVAEFFLLCCHPDMRSDLLFPGDRGLFWRRLARFLRTLS